MIRDRFGLRALVCAVALSGSLALPSQAAVVASYGLNGNGVDGSGNGLTLALSGTSAATDRFGTSAAALAFDGSSSYAEYQGGGLGLLNVGTSSWTLTAWVNTTGSNGHQSVVGRYRCGWSCGGGPVDAAVYELYLLGNVAGFWLRTDQDNAFQLQAPGALSVNAWHMLAAVLDQVAMTVSLYVDGALATSLPYLPGQTLDLSGAPLEIGRRFIQTFVPPETHFAGAIDDVTILNTALSPEDIAAMATVPEPSTFAVLGLAMLGVTMLGRRRPGREQAMLNRAG